MLHNHVRLFFPLCLLSFLAFALPQRSRAAAGNADSSQGHHGFQKFTDMFEGIKIGKHSRLFPYASIEDWFDPYGGLKFEHPTPWNSDRIVQNFKFETIRDYSWKFRYQAISLSGPRLTPSFIFKLKYDRDSFFYGIGNSIPKSARQAATYGSVFAGMEFESPLSEKLTLLISPGYWSFQSGLKSGGDFEQAADARYATLRLSLSGAEKLDYTSQDVSSQLSAYVESGMPVTKGVSSYARINAEAQTRIPLFGKVKFGALARSEYLVSGGRAKTPYFVLPEAGSRSGLRAYSKERFRNFSLLQWSFELTHPLTKHFEFFLLTDLAQTGSDPVALPSNTLHSGFGAGLRLFNKNSPISAGMAYGQEGWKAFSTISAALSF